MSSEERRSSGDFNEEIRAHIEIEADRLVEEGMDREQALHSARKAFGSMVRSRRRFDDSARWSWLHRLRPRMGLLRGGPTADTKAFLVGAGVGPTDWIRELKRAGRSLLKQRGFAAVAILTLALGIGANTAIFSVIDGALLRPLPYSDPDGLVYLSDGHPDFGGTGINQSIPNLLDLRSGSRLLDDAAIFTFGDGNLATEERPERVRILRTSHELLHVLGVSPRLGRDLRLENDLSGSQAVAILTDQTWRARFGADPGIVGRTTRLDAAPVEIIGVLPPDFSFPGTPDLIMPLQHVGEEFRRDSRNYNGIGRLIAGARIEALRDELAAIFAGLTEQYPRPNDDWYTWADPIREFAVPMGGQSLFLFAGAVGLVLLMACVNVANLLIVRAEGRQREFALRYSLGASRAAMVPLFVSEGMVLSLLGGLVGILTARWGIGALVNFFGNSIPRADQIGLSGTALTVGVATSLLVGLLVGLMPLVRTNSDHVAEDLKEGARGSSGRTSRLGGALVVIEVALAVLLVSGAGLLTRSVLERPEHRSRHRGRRACVDLHDRAPTGEVCGSAGYGRVS